MQDQPMPAEKAQRTLEEAVRLMEFAVAVHHRDVPLLLEVAAARLEIAKYELASSRPRSSTEGWHWLLRAIHHPG